MRSTEQQLWPVLYIAPSASDAAASLRVGVVADVGRVLAAEFELQLDQARAQRLRDPRAGGVGAGEEQAVDVLRQQRRADLAGADQRDEHVLRHAGLVQQAARSPGRSAWRIRRACTAPRCRSAAPARTRCRRRTRGSSRPRCWPPRRAARARSARACRRRRTRSRSPTAALDLLRGRSRCAPSKPLSSLRDMRDRLADLGGHDRRPARRAARRRAARKRCDAGQALGQRAGGPGRLRGARRGGLGGDAGGVVGRHVGDQARRWRGCGWSELVHGVFSWFGRRVRRSRKSCRIGASFERAVLGLVELRVPLHAGDPGRRRCGGSPRSCRRPGCAPRRRSPCARSLTPWWCTLLMVWRFSPGSSCARRLPGTSSTSWKFRS